jgi:NADPH:quinone reductase-like Zn-dependent oxidoreductase
MTSQIITSPTRLARLIAIPPMPESQSQLLLHEAKTPYKVEDARSIPELLPGELLVQVQAIGLNPIDWKSASVNLWLHTYYLTDNELSEYGFALPAFPCVNGREFVGQIVRQHSSLRTDLTIGNKVCIIELWTSLGVVQHFGLV